MKKNVNVKIVDYDYFGRGISKENGHVCFVPKAKKGFVGTCLVEEEKKSFLLASLKEEGKEKVNCPYFYQCGGCHLRHISYEEQKEFKIEKVRSLFQKNAGLFLSDISIETPILEAYRNKVVFHLEKGQVGFFKEGTNELLPITNCLLLPKKLNAVLKELELFSKETKRTMTATARILNETVMLSLEEEQTHSFSYDFQTVDSLFYQGKLLKGDPTLEVSILGISFSVSKDAFFQVNLKGMEVLYQKVMQDLLETKAKKVLDLYCGVGSISLIASKVVSSVIGVEVVPSAVLNARNNQEKNKISNVSFHCGKVEELLSILPKDYDTVILDPPRRGLDRKTKEFLKKNLFQHLIYVSCDPATLARDVKDLEEKYTLKRLELVDMFPNTYHVECVCVLKLK